MPTYGGQRQRPPHTFERPDDPTVAREVHPAGPDRGHEPVLASDQVFAVPSARPCHATLAAYLRPDDEAVLLDKPSTRSLFCEAVELNPEHEDSLYYLATCLASQGDTEGALAQLAELKRIGPQSQRVYRLASANPFVMSFRFTRGRFKRVESATNTEIPR